MSRSILSKVLALLLCAGSLVITPAYGQTNGSGKNNSWQFTGQLYLWGAAMSGKTRSGSDFDVDFKTIAENLDMSFMGSLEARKSDWVFNADVIYLNVSGDNSTSVPVSALPSLGLTVDVDADLRIKGYVVNLLAGYTLRDTQHGTLDGFIGTRYLNLDSDIKLRIGNNVNINRNISASGDVWDGVVGLRGKLNIKDGWYLPYYLDVGTGQSDLTWQALGGIGYKFRWGNALLAYRHIEWTFDNVAQLDDLTFSGPGLGVSYNF